MVASKLNPEATEFFPRYDTIYYSFPYISYPKNQTLTLTLLENNSDLPPPVTEPDPLIAVSDQTQLVTKEVSPRGSRRGYYKNRKGRGFFNGREREILKQEWREKARQTVAVASSSSSCSKRNHHHHHRLVPISPDGPNTTVMIRNIPNRYSREMLMEFLDNHCMQENQKAQMENEIFLSAFDFLYLPMDFNNEANKGYAFVNFTNARAAWKFHQAVHNKGWDLFQSKKVCEIAAARLQGKEELERHFQSSVFECETDDYLPVCYSPARDGSNASVVKQWIVGRRLVAGNQI